jgi:hypothetical protein
MYERQRASLREGRYRDVTLEGKQKVKLTLTAPAGKRIRGLVPQEGSDVGFLVTDKGTARRPRATARIPKPC